MSPRPRLVIYVLITLALLGAGWWAGGFGLLLAADHIHALPVAGAYALLGLLQGWRGKWTEGDTLGTIWLAERAPLFGMAGTLWGILAVIPLALAGGDPHAMMGELLSAPIATLMGVGVYGYLDLAAHVCER